MTAPRRRLPRPRRVTPLAERFWRKVDAPPEGCWGWKGAIKAEGYGHLSVGRAGEGVVKAHRVSWELHFGPIPPGMLVLHRCDNRVCVNPEHLFLGTQKDNLRDMVQKGRYAHRGSGVSLPDAALREARWRSARGARRDVLAAELGVTTRYVQRVLNHELRANA